MDFQFRHYASSSIDYALGRGSVGGKSLAAHYQSTLFFSPHWKRNTKALEI